MALTEEQRDFLEKTYLGNNKDNARTLELFKDEFGFRIVNRTLYSILEEREVEIDHRNYHAHKKYGQLEQEFPDFYEHHKGDVTAMVEATGMRPHSLVNLCKKYELEPKNVPPMPSLKPKGSRDKYTKYKTYYSDPLRFK